MADFRAAEKQLQIVLGVDSSNATAYENLARLYYDRGRLVDTSYLLLAHLVVSQALRVLEQEGKQSADLHNLRGLLLMEEHDPIEALRAFERAVKVEPSHADANLNLALVALRFRAFARAEETLAVALHPKRGVVHGKKVEAHLAMAVAKRGLGKLEAAETHCNKAAALDPDDPRPWYNLGLLYQEHLSARDDVDGPALERLYERAQEHYRKFLSVAGKNRAHAREVQDAKDRIVIIDDYFQGLAQQRVLEARVRKLEAEAQAAELADRQRRLDLERRALEQQRQAQTRG
jgi:tetratricopeptide (TPR) repeat protein